MTDELRDRIEGVLEQYSGSVYSETAQAIIDDLNLELKEMIVDDGSIPSPCPDATLTTSPEGGWHAEHNGFDVTPEFRAWMRSLPEKKLIEGELK